MRLPDDEAKRLEVLRGLVLHVAAIHHDPVALSPRGAVDHVLRAAHGCRHPGCQLVGRLREREGLLELALPRSVRAERVPPARHAR